MQDDFITIISAAGSILSAFSAILITILIFAININSQQIPGSTSFVKLLIKKLRYKPVIAYVFGTIISILSALAATQILSCELLQIMLALVVLSIVAVIVELWVLFETIKYLGLQPAVQLLKKEFLANHDRAFRVDVKILMKLSIYMGKLKNNGFSWSLLHRSANMNEVNYYIGARGKTVTDVYFEPLSKIKDIWGLKPIEGSNYSSSTPIIPTFPGEEVENTKNNILALVVDKTSEEPEIQSLLEKTFMLGRKRVPCRSSHFDWEHLSNLCKYLIRRRAAEGLRETLDAFKDIVKDYFTKLNNLGLKHQDSDPIRRCFSDYEPPSLEAIRIDELVTTVVTAGDTACLRGMYSFLYGLALQAIESEDENYFQKPVYWLSCFYTQNTKQPSLVKDIEEFTLRYFDHIREDIEMYKDGEKSTAEIYSHLYPYIRSYFNSTLHALSRAAYEGEEEIFDSLLYRADQLFEHDIDKGARGSWWSAKPGNETSARYDLENAKMDIWDLRLFAHLVIGAWIMAQVLESELSFQVAQRLMKKSLEIFEEERDLVDVYLYTEQTRMKQPFDFENWRPKKKIFEQAYVFWPVAVEKWIKPLWIVEAINRDLKHSSTVKCDNLRHLDALKNHTQNTFEALIRRTVTSEPYQQLLLCSGSELDSRIQQIIGLFDNLSNHHKEDA